MAQALALEIYFLVERLLAEKSPLVESLEPHWRNDYFEDLVATWKRMDRHTAELAEVKRSVQQLSALMLPFPNVEPAWSGNEVVAQTLALDVGQHSYTGPVSEVPPPPPPAVAAAVTAPVAGTSKSAKRSRAPANPTSRKKAPKTVGSMPALDF